MNSYLQNIQERIESILLMELNVENNVVQKIGTFLLLPIIT
jgi:hypothetical protein